MQLTFRALRADEVECRIGNVSKTGTGVSLLLYKDARCDMNVLDETVGAMGWKKCYSRDNRNCTVSIRDTDTGEWIGKEDTGTESASEAEKGLASDSFKRACVNWGIGRELYTAPFIWISGASKYDRFWVKEMSVENKRITSLLICKCDKYGKHLDEEVFEFPEDGKKASATKQQETKEQEDAKEHEEAGAKTINEMEWKALQSYIVSLAPQKPENQKDMKRLLDDVLARFGHTSDLWREITVGTQVDIRKAERDIKDDLAKNAWKEALG